MAGEQLRIGRYAVFEPFAEGGMATLHFGRVFGPAGFSRVVALKRLHPPYAASSEVAPALVDEARLLSRIRHPNVVTTLDVLQEGRELLLVLEYVHGEALHRLLAAAAAMGKPAPPRIASAIVCGTLEGLHAAHEAKNEAGEPLALVHRDVSPQNILVGLDGVPRVVDFGVAKATGRAQITRPGTVKGKVAYMAPEQVLGDQLDRRADLFAVGLVLYELLTAERLIKVDGAMGAARAILELEVPDLRGRNDIGVELAAVLERALDRNPARRFDTARAMSMALEAAAPPASPREVGAWVDAMAGETLRARAAVVGAIEARHLVEGEPPAPAPRPAAPRRPDATETMTAARAVRATKRSRWPWIAVAALLLVASAAATRGRPADPPPAPPVPAARTPALPAAPAPAPAPPAAPAPIAGAVEVAPRATLDPPPAPRRPREARPPSPPPPAAPEAVAAPDPCDPPYRLDDQGIRRLKRECM